MSENRAHHIPLRAYVNGGVLKIFVGAETLASAFERSEQNNPYNEQTEDFEQQYYVENARRFAVDVCCEINREGEDGSTPLTRFLDAMMQKAVEQGSLGLRDPEENE